MADLTDYWLTFRIGNVTVGGVTSNQRRDALYDTINDLSSSWWVEPTSFILFDSHEGIEAIAAKCRSAISASNDMVLIRKLNKQDAQVIGKIDNPDMLRAFMPYLPTK